MSTKVALVLGGSRGIGRAIVERLASENYSIFFTYASNQVAAEDVISTVRSKTGAQIHASQNTAANAAEVEALMKTIKNVYGRIDAIVYNAGLLRVMPLDAITEETYDLVLQTNTKSFFLVTQAAAKGLLQDGGRVVYISSTASRVGVQGQAVYAASKAASEAMVRVWAAELGPRNISVNSVSPGVTNTDMIEPHPELTTHGAIASPMNRVGEPEEIATAVSFLVKDCAWVTGQNIHVNGAIYMSS